MSHGKLRTEKNCLNCGHLVEEKFCPNCGQENTEPKQKFHFLFTHFIEDFTHYDGQFWKTIKYLLFKPGKLTNEYLAGKRQKYVAPVKLYIFVSFVTFFLFSLSPSLFSVNPSIKNDAATIEAKKQIAEAIKSEELSAEKNGEITKEDSLTYVKIKDIVGNSLPDAEKNSDENFDTKLSADTGIYGAKNKIEYEAYQKKHPSWSNSLERPFAYKFFELKEMGISKKEILAKFSETAFHNLPKALFIYLPLFAFFLWLFHNKKKWWYFDHGIFTLHYFSFLLLITTTFWLLGRFTNMFAGNGFINFVKAVSVFVITVYTFLYFFLAHYRVYHSGKKFSVLIGISLFIINFFAFMVVLTGLMALSFLMVK